MKVTIEKITAIRQDNDASLAFTKVGAGTIRTGDFIVGDLILYFHEMNMIKHIENYEALRERFMQEGDDVTHFLYPSSDV